MKSFNKIRPLAIYLISFTIALLLSEYLLRTLYKSNNGQIVYEQKFGHYSYKENSTFLVKNEDQVSVPINIDELGYRNKNDFINESDGIILGDSFISAINTISKNTIASNLNFYNAGVDGSSTYEQVQTLKYLLSKKKFRKVILGFYLGNDFRDNYIHYKQGGLSFYNAQPFCMQLMLCDLLYKKIYIGLLKGLGRDPFASYPLAEMTLIKRASSEQIIFPTINVLRELNSLSKREGFDLYVVGIPSKAQVKQSFREISGFHEDSRAKEYALNAIKSGVDFDGPDKELNKICLDLGIPYITLLEKLRGSGIKDLYYQIDLHWGPSGQAIATDVLIDRLNLRSH